MPIGRFTDKVPKVVGKPWAGGVDRQVWLWMKKVGEATNGITSTIISFFGGPGGSSPGLLTTKGDLLGFDTGMNRVPVGADGEVLTADSAEALGLSYQTPAGAGAALFDKCVSFWRLEEASGPRRDSIGRYRFNDLTDNNTVTGATGKVGNAAHFTGANSESLDISNATQQGLNPGVGDFSISAWVNPTSLVGSNIYTLVAKGATGNAPNAEGYWIFLFGPTIGALGVRFGDGVQVTRGCQFNAAYTFVAGTWYHVVVTFDRDGDASAYINGALVDTAAMNNIGPSDGACNPTVAFTLGHAPPSVGDYLDADEDAVGYFDSVLTPAEVSALYANGAGRELLPSWGVRWEDSQGISAHETFLHRPSSPAPVWADRENMLANQIFGG